MRSVSLRATFSPGNSYFLLPLLVLVLLLSHREEDEFGFEVLPGEFFGFDDGEGAFITGGFTHEGGDTLAEAGEVAFLRASPSLLDSTFFTKKIHRLFFSCCIIAGRWGNVNGFFYCFRVKPCHFFLSVLTYNRI